MSNKNPEQNRYQKLQLLEKEYGEKIDEVLRLLQEGAITSEESDAKHTELKKEFQKNYLISQKIS